MHMRNLKKICSAITGSVLIISTLLCGCGNNSENNVENDTESGAENLDYNIDNTRTDTWYEIFVYSFCDSDGDGIGDLNGVDEKIGYLKELGISGIWLMPVCPSDSYHKYDVNDYEDIDPQYGTMEDFDKLVKDCHANGIRVITDLVVNHTGAHNKWFTRACDYLKEHPAIDFAEGEEASQSKDQTSDMYTDDGLRYVEYYNFSNEKKAGYNKVEGTDYYYESQFSPDMPDLNWNSQYVYDEIKSVMKFWTDHGVDGFRLDAAKEYYSGNSTENKKVLSWLENTAKELNPDAYLVAEVWDTFGTIQDYYSSGITSIFNYPFGNSDGQIVKTINGAGNESRVGKYAPNIEKAESAYRSSNPSFIDAPFLSNHDTGRISGFLNYDEDKMKLAGAMILFMSGNSFIYYGEELGMSGSGNDPSKRAPMYWSDKDNASDGMNSNNGNSQDKSEIDISQGKSGTDASQDESGLTTPPPGCTVQENKFGSFDEQKNDESSIYNYYRKAISIKASCPEIAEGVSTADKTLNKGSISAVKKTMKTKYDGENSCVILYNISDKEQTLELNLNENGLRLCAELETGSEKVHVSENKIEIPAWGIAVIK